MHLAITITGLPREGVDLVEWNIPRRARGSVGVNPERRFQMCAVRRRGCFFVSVAFFLASAFFPVVCLLRNVACRMPVARVNRG